MKVTAEHLLRPVLCVLLMLSCSVMNKEDLTKNTKQAYVTKAAKKSSNLIFVETVEGTNPFSTARSMEVGSWDYALQFVTNPVFEGLKSVRFEIRKDQQLIKNGKRSEIVIVKGSKGDITKDTWYSFAAYFPTVGYEYDTEREVINQWYQNGTPATSLRTQKDRFLLESGNMPGNRKRYDLGQITKNTWQEFVLHFIHSNRSDGLIEIWHNGKKVLTRRGGNMYKDVLPKWKIGLYKAAFKNDKSLVTRRIIYFDNIRVGNSKATYADMTSLQNTQYHPLALLQNNW